jgi:membrane-bound lytic murein transglycosylase F
MKALLRLCHAVLRWLLLLSLLPLSTCSPKPTALERAKLSGRLVVATTNSPNTCYDGPLGPTGFECDLLRGLASKLGVKLELRYFDNTPQAVDAAATGEVDLAAAAIDVTPARTARVHFSRPLQQVALQLVYNGDDDTPQDLDDLDGELDVVPGGSGEEMLKALQAQHPTLKWSPADQDNDVGDLLYQVSEGELDYTVASSDVVALNQRYYPKLRVAFALGEQRDQAWALPPDQDASLFQAVQGYLEQMAQGELARLRDRYFSRPGGADYEGVVQFSTDVRERLPRYLPLFRQAAQRYGMDWRVLAAIGYQESHWDPAAVSPTGVRGMMMLTTETAVDVAVADRADAAQSIHGGARYFQGMLKELPPQVAEPDRTWMALAAYNQGIGHLLDARALAAQLGGDPDRWLDVRNALPLLSRERWFKKTRHGYSRGGEAVGFVGNVRNYYDMLSWMTQDDAPPATPVQALADGPGKLQPEPPAPGSDQPGPPVAEALKPKPLKARSLKTGPVNAALLRSASAQPLAH